MVLEQFDFSVQLILYTIMEVSYWKEKIAFSQGRTNILQFIQAESKESSNQKHNGNSNYLSHTEDFGIPHNSAGKNL